LNEKKQLLKNAFTSVVQVIIVSASLFILYKYLLNTLGVEKLGIWSLILAISSIGSISKFGFTGSVVKYVAQYRAKQDINKIHSIIGTSVVTVGFVSSVLILIFYPIAGVILEYVVPLKNLKESMDLLPYGLLALWIMVIMSIFFSALEGSHRIDQRTYVFSGGSVFYLLLCFFLVPKYGILGLAYGRVIQMFLMLIIAIFLVKRIYNNLKFKDFFWNKNTFNELLIYSLNIQVASISQMFYEPLTKALLTKFGSLEVTGYYEMASRMIAQVRNLTVASGKALVPFVSHNIEKKNDNIIKYYRYSLKVMSFFSIFIFFLVVILSPFISILWIGSYNYIFILTVFFISFAWFINVLSATSYLFYQGIGKLKINSISHILILVFNLILSFLLGNFWGWKGVVVGWSLAIIIGSLYIIISFHKEYSILSNEIFNRKNGLFFILTVVYFLSYYLIIIYIRFDNLYYYIYLVVTLIYLSFFVFSLKKDFTKIFGIFNVGSK